MSAHLQALELIKRVNPVDIVSFSDWVSLMSTINQILLCLKNNCSLNIEWFRDSKAVDKSISYGYVFRIMQTSQYPIN